MTHRSSKTTLGMTLPAIVLCLLSGCASNKVPRDALRLQESTLDVRSIQTRTFVAPSANDILTATIATLQDLEFNIDQIEKSLGVITASKVSDADSTGEQVGLWVLAILCGCGDVTSAKDEQHITVTMVVLPSLGRRDEFMARITIQRVIYDKAERVKVLERLDDPQIYREVFDNLSKAMFIQVSAND